MSSSSEPSSPIEPSSPAEDIMKKIESNLEKTKDATATVEGIIDKFNTSNSELLSEVDKINSNLVPLIARVNDIKAQKTELPRELAELLNTEQAEVERLIAAIADTKGVVTKNWLQEGGIMELQKTVGELQKLLPAAPDLKSEEGAAKFGGARTRKGGYIIAAHKKKSHTRKSRSTLRSSRRSKTRKRERKRKGGKK